MDIYLTSLALGAVGLAAMAFGGSGRSGHGHGHGHATGGHGGHGGHAGHSHGGHAHGLKETTGHSLLALMSPRLLFSVALGFGASGLVARPLFGAGILLFTIAVCGAILFERLIVTPLWNLLFKFESAPALTLESAVTGEATVVSTFDTNGQGLISVEVDGQLLQVLGTLHPDSRALAGRVAVGTRVRIDDVDAARNRCTVSLL